MIWLSHYEYCCLYRLYYAKSCKLDTQLSEKTTLNFVLLLFSCLPCNVVMRARCRQMRSHFHATLFPRVARWSSAACITATTSSQEDKQSKNLLLYIFNFLAVPTRRRGAWRVSKETTQLWTVTAVFLWIRLACWWLGSKLISTTPGTHDWSLERTTQDEACLKSLRSLFMQVDPLLRWVIWGVKSHWLGESNCFNLIFLWYD